MNTQVVIGAQFTNGMGRANHFFRDDPVRIDVLTRMLGSPMIGTFNLRASVSDVHAVRDLPPTCKLTHDEITYICHLCELTNDTGDIWPVFMYQWEDPRLTSRCPPKGMIETISRAPIPDSFKAWRLQLKVYRPFTDDERAAWIKQQPYWFQTFPWGPAKWRGRKNADSALQWHTIEPHAEWTGCTVLDIGGAHGYHSFEASRRGAIVTLVDLANVLQMSRQIGHHIECRDIRYVTDAPGDRFDVIMYLSVHHQLDGTYRQLSDKIGQLKARCRKLFVELIDPVAGAGGTWPVRTELSLADVNAIMGSEPLLTYKHNVRALRHIWMVAGELAGAL